MKFNYKAQKNTGEIVLGNIETEDKFALARHMRSQGMTLVSAQEVKQSLAISIPLLDSFFGKIKIEEKIVFAKNLSGMLSAGLSLNRALVVLQKQTSNQKFKKILTEIMQSIDQGNSLSQSVAKYPHVFSPLFISMIRAGEESGSLSKALLEISSHLERTYTLNRKIKGAMMYPMIILGAILLIGSLMLIYVVPTLTKTFVELNIELPATTRFIIFISDLFAHNTLALLAGFIGFVLCIMYLVRFPRVQQIFDLVLIRLPVIGVLTKQINSSRTARTLSSLLSSGVDVRNALLITKDVIQNSYYKNVIDLALTAVEKGTPLSKVFKEKIDLYPVMVGEMMEVGEETGKLSQMLLDMALFYEAEVSEKTKDLSTIIEPILMLFIGGAVGFFAISMITPLYSIMDSIQ